MALLLDQQLQVLMFANYLITDQLRLYFHLLHHQCQQLERYHLKCHCCSFHFIQDQGLQQLSYFLQQDQSSLCPAIPKVVNLQLVNILDEYVSLSNLYESDPDNDKQKNIHGHFCSRIDLYQQLLLLYSFTTLLDLVVLNQ